MKTMKNISLGGRTVRVRIEGRPFAGGAWITGKTAGHRFSALVFAEHALRSEYEIGRSRISKLWLKRLADERTAYNWDRGADVAPIDTTAQDIVKDLVDNLADALYGPAAN